jgi:hypothetical protein
MIPHSDSQRWLAFSAGSLVAEGDLQHVAARTKAAIDRGELSSVQLFEAATSRQVDLDYNGSLDEVLARLERRDDPAEAVDAAPRPRGRPRLGVVSREVTLLPRHWDWLARQPGGASVTLRKLVDIARRGDDSAIRLRGARERLYRFMSPMAGDRPGFEEASRALFAGKRERWEAEIAEWPVDIRRHLRELAEEAFGVGA